MSTCVLVVIYIYIYICICIIYMYIYIHTYIMYSFLYIICTLCIRNSSVINLYSTLHLTAIEIQYLIAIEMQ